MKAIFLAPAALAGLLLVGAPAAPVAAQLATHAAQDPTAPRSVDYQAAPVLKGSGPVAPPADNRLQRLTLPATPHPQSVLPPVASQIDAIHLEVNEIPASGLYLAALAGLAGGYLIGGIAGFRMEQANSDYCDMFCGVGGALLGGWALGSMGGSFGAHIANDLSGNVLLGTGSTLLVGAGGAVVAAAATMVSPGLGALVLLGVPVVQVHTAVRVEQITASRRVGR
jgi:hypothetical protein